MKKLSPVIAAFALLLLIGQGCAKEEAPATDTTMGEEQPAAQQMNDDSDAESMSGTIELTGRPVGDYEAQFSWTLPEGMDAPEKYLLVRSEAENPEHDGKNFWFRVPGGRTSTIWTDLPEGPWNFRLCVLEGETCTAYSNNVFVQINN